MTLRVEAEIWLTQENACALLKCTPRHLRRASREWTTRASESRGCNGKKQREYPLNSFPADAQARFAEERKQRLSIVSPAEQTLPLFASVPAAERIAIPEALEEQARRRFEASQEVYGLIQRTNDGRQAIQFADGKTVRTVNEIVAYVAAKVGKDVSTVNRWRQKLKRRGLAALANAPRKGQGQYFPEHPAAALYLQNKYLKEGLSMLAAFEALIRDWSKIGESGKSPCYDTARNFLNELPEPLKVLAREGPEAHHSRCSPFIQRGKVPVMSWWVSDHRLFDVLVRNSLFAELKRDQAYRLWMTLVVDWGSRKIIGFCLAPEPSSRTINSSLRMAILSHGIPQNFYADNGRDYSKVRRDLELITLSDEAKALLGRDRVGITSALPYRPRSKPIESWFARWSKRFDVIWRPAYLGNKPGNCPEAGRAAQKQHDDFLRGKRSESPLPVDAEFIAATIQWIEEYNETRLEALDLRTPNECMEAAHPERNRQAVNPRLLDILFCEREKRVVQAGGCVQLDGMAYEPVEESLFALDMKKGRTVMILRDAYNLGEAVAADAETLQFIGELRIQQFVAQCPNGRITRDQIKAAMRRERGLRRGYAEYLALLSAVATNQGWKTEREGLLERAGIARVGLRTGTDGAPALPAAAVPGARRIPERAVAQMSSPFVDDAVADFMEAMKEESPTFVSDAVAQDTDAFKKIELEED